MKLHLVGGFLGSGKTTAIANACKILSDKGITTSVITNDQGNYLVDSRFVEQSSIPFAEVTGGCFCCNYNQLDSQINALANNHNPSVIFAEFVGSCTDLVATVLKPLLEYKKTELEQVTFSSFVDAHLLLMHLQGKALPFSMETNYIWEKQIEEAEILIVNKIDLLSPFELESLQALIKGLYPTKQLLFQNSLDQNSVTHWVETIRKQQDTEHKTIDVDYVKYGAGEANLAWLDEEIEIVTTNNTAVEVAYGFIKGLLDDILKKSLTIGHMKFYLSYNNQSSKISFTTVLDVSEQFPANFEKASTVNLLVNARIQTSSNELRDILFNNLHQMKSLDGVVINEKFLSYFQPGYPNPTHRLA